MRGGIPHRGRRVPALRTPHRLCPSHQAFRPHPPVSAVFLPGSPSRFSTSSSSSFWSYRDLHIFGVGDL